MRKKGSFFSKIAMSKRLKIGLIREISLYFPCIIGKFIQRRVRSGLVPPPPRLPIPDMPETEAQKPAELGGLGGVGCPGDRRAGAIWPELPKVSGGGFVDNSLVE